MNWIRITQQLPPLDEIVLIAYGYIFDDGTPPYFSFENYNLYKFNSDDINNLEDFGTTMWLNGRSIAYWTKVENPFEKEFVE